MGSTGSMRGGGSLTLSDGERVKVSDLNSMESWRNIANYGFSDVKVRYDGQMLRKDTTRPVGEREMAKGYMSSLDIGGAASVANNLTRPRNIGMSTQDSFFVDTLNNVNRITIESSELSDALAPTLIRKGFTLVGTSEPPQRMAYALWEKK